ncbi:hypothetical protein MMC13_002410 [Lambiella insularis]|nr:hypothetical protein [Lambiella insularis]
MADMEQTLDVEVVNVIIIHPKGDVYLALRGIELLVLSEHLRSFSPVFDKLFSPYFSEGREVSTTAPGKVILSEDDADAMTLLCQIVDHRYQQVVLKGPSFVILEKLAMLADKYDCIESLSIWVKQKLSEAINQ